MTSIYDLANQLERAIRELPEYQAVLAAKEKVDADAEAKAVFEEFTAFNQTIYTQIQAGQLPSEEDQKTIEALGQKVDANPHLKAFFQAQQALGVYANDMERIVFKPFQDLAH